MQHTTGSQASFYAVFLPRYLSPFTLDSFFTRSLYFLHFPSSYRIPGIPCFRMKLERMRVQGGSGHEGAEKRREPKEGSKLVGGWTRKGEGWSVLLT